MPGIRLVFSYDGDDVRLVHQSPVDAESTPPAPTGPGEHVEVRTAAGQVRGSTPVHPPMSAGMEVFPADHAAPLSRTELSSPRGAFTVVVPWDPDADHVTVLRRTAGPAAPGGAAASVASAGTVRELGSFPLEAGGR